MINALKKKITNNFFIPNIVYVLLGGLIVRLILSGFGTLHLDQGTFIAWSANISEGGFKNFYSGWSDYLPGYLYVLWLLGHLRGLIPDTLLYKLPATISDLLTAFLIYKILKGKKGLFGAGIYLLNPAIFANSALWGQVDSFTALFSTLSIYLLPNKYLLSAASLAIGTLIKPQAAFLAPLILLMMIKNKFSMSKILAFGFLAFSIFVLAFIPFNSGNLIEFIISRLTVSANQYPYTAVNAFNFWGLSGQWKPDSPLFQFGGYFTFLILFFYISRKLKEFKNYEYVLASLIFAFSFLFFTRMHERHLLPVFAPLTILAAGETLYLIPLLGFSIVYIFNLIYSYKWITQDFLISFDPFPLIILNLMSLAILVFVSLKKEKAQVFFGSLVAFFKKGRRTTSHTMPKFWLSTKQTKAVLIAILIFTFFARVYRIGIPPTDYFDEIYHAFTARIILHNDPKAWEWWNPHPEGFAYEWTHPPFSKLIMVGGMKLFGENAIGWRIPQALFGTLSVLLVYLLSRRIFRDDGIALLSAFIFSLDGLNLVLSRMAMNDVYVLFFMLSSVYFFMKGKDVISAISLGFAIASKWSAIWTIPILFVLWLKRKKKFNLSTFLAFIFLPFTVYLLTYLPMFLTGHDLGTWWGMQKQMWWYHTGLRATHPYTSPWWSWPLNLRPVYLYTSEEIGGIVSRIYAFGNPFIFWVGLASIISGAIYAYFEKNKSLGLVVFSYLIFFAPWAASPRIMFLYHYLPSIPFMCMATAYVLRRFPKTTFSFLAFSFLAFVYFYPHWAGLPIPLWLDRSYYWINSWR